MQQIRPSGKPEFAQSPWNGKIIHFGGKFWNSALAPAAIRGTIPLFAAGGR
jgi:hypothetical protein